VATVTFEKVVKRYSEQAVILRGIDLEVHDGEFLVLVGPSGCGKSTLLRTLAGLERIEEGAIRIGDRPVGDLPPKDRDIAMVFQSYALYPHMTVRENMAFGLTVRRMPAAEIARRVDEAAALLGITHLLDRLPKEMSGGQRQRVAMGRAIVRSPQVFLFDEPLSNLDAALRTQMRIELKHLHRRLGATIIYVTHDQIEAMTLADRIVVLDKGVIQQIGTPAELYDRPANTFVARFIGTPAMNLFDIEPRDGAIFGGAVRLPGTARRIVAGIRPSDLTVATAPGGIRLDGTVDLVEALGATAVAHFRLDADRRITAELPAVAARGLAAGATVTLTAAPDRVHLFDGETGLRIADRA